LSILLIIYKKCSNTSNGTTSEPLIINGGLLKASFNGFNGLMGGWVSPLIFLIVLSVISVFYWRRK
jgi:hypothetical protein